MKLLIGHSFFICTQLSLMAYSMTLYLSLIHINEQGWADDSSKARLTVPSIQLSHAWRTTTKNGELFLPLLTDTPKFSRVALVCKFKKHSLVISDSGNEKQGKSACTCHQWLQCVDKQSQLAVTFKQPLEVSPHNQICLPETSLSVAMIECLKTTKK